MTVRVTGDVPMQYSRSDWVSIMGRMEEALNALYAGSLVGRLSASSAPSTGSWARGDVVWNNAPAGGGSTYVGWVCVTAGTPGTWKGFGLIET